MKKNVSFFNFLNKTIIILGEYIIIFIVASLITFLSYYNHKKEEVTYLKEMEIYQQEKIDQFNAYFSEDSLNIIIKLKTHQEDEFLLAYTYHYYDLYLTSIYLSADNITEIKYVTINKQGLSSIS